MKKIFKQLAVGLILLTTLAGCAAVPSIGPDNEVQAEIGSTSRTKNVLLTIGGVLLVGAIIANEAGDNVRDGIRDANHR